jgi:hypothetical protein
MREDYNRKNEKSDDRVREWKRYPELQTKNGIRNPKLPPFIRLFLVS